jgi:hypothetical protein
MGVSKQKPGRVGETTYSSRKEVAESFSIAEATVGFRIKSTSFPDWNYY